jgi:hypothetical protein
VLLVELTVHLTTHDSMPGISTRMISWLYFASLRSFAIDLSLVDMQLVSR